MSELVSQNPATGAPLGSIKPATTADYDAAVRASLAAFARWREVPAPRRGEIVRQIGEAFGMIAGVTVEKHHNPGGRPTTFDLLHPPPHRRSVTSHAILLRYGVSLSSSTMAKTWPRPKMVGGMLILT